MPIKWVLTVFMFALHISALTAEDKPFRAQLPEDLGAPIGENRKPTDKTTTAEALDEQDLSDVTRRYNPEGTLERVDYTKTDGTKGTAVPKKKPLNAKFYPGKIRKSNEYGHPLNTEYWGDGSRTKGKFRNWRYAPLEISELPCVVSSDDEIIKACMRGELNVPLGTHCLKPMLDANGNPTELYSLNGSPALSSFINTGYGYQPDVRISGIGDPDPNFEVRYNPGPEINRIPQDGILSEESFGSDGTDRIVSAIDLLREEIGIHDRQMLEFMMEAEERKKGSDKQMLEMLKESSDRKDPKHDPFVLGFQEKSPKKESRSDKSEEQCETKEESHPEAPKENFLQKYNTEENRQGVEDLIKFDFNSALAQAKQKAKEVIGVDFENLKPETYNIEVPDTEDDFWVIKWPAIAGNPSGEIDLNIKHQPEDVQKVIRFIKGLLVILISGFYFFWVWPIATQTTMNIFKIQPTRMAEISATPVVKPALKAVSYGIIVAAWWAIVAYLPSISTYTNLQNTGVLKNLKIFNLVSVSETYIKTSMAGSRVLTEVYGAIEHLIPIDHIFNTIGTAAVVLVVSYGISLVAAIAVKLIPS